MDENGQRECRKIAQKAKRAMRTPFKTHEKHTKRQNGKTAPTIKEYERTEETTSQKKKIKNKKKEQNSTEELTKSYCRWAVDASKCARVKSTF